MMFNKPEAIKTENRHFERSVREALEIQRHRSAPRYGGINLDDGQYLKTTFWMPYMDWLSKEEKERADKRIRRQMPSRTNPGARIQNLTSDGEGIALEEVVS